MEVTPVDRKGLGEGVRRELCSALLYTRAMALGVEMPHCPHGVE